MLSWILAADWFSNSKMYPKITPLGSSEREIEIPGNVRKNDSKHVSLSVSDPFQDLTDIHKIKKEFKVRPPGIPVKHMQTHQYMHAHRHS